MTDYAKLDAGLILALRRFESEASKSEPDKAISVILQFQGDVAPLEALGFSTPTVIGRSEAIGTVRFNDLLQLAANANVLRISAGRPNRTALDTAVRDFHARAPSPAAIGTGGVWHADVATGALTSGAGGATGKDVIIAVLDSGIDVSHPMFNKTISPHYDSRILKIWDQGLRPQAGESGPDKSLLLSPVTYGVEFDTAAINRALNISLFPLLPLDFRHLDCDGHGTHVASIAAGAPTFAPSTDAARVGVAPEADIIIVKVQDNPAEIRDVNNNVVSDDIRIRDAIIYCLRVAKSRHKPIVINCSLGTMGLPGDGLDPESRWLHETFNPALPADNTHFPKGAVLVKSAGNQGDVEDRVYARITVPDAGVIDVPIELYDSRGPNRTGLQTCVRNYDVGALNVFLSYRDVPAPQDVYFASRVPTEAAFSNEIAAGFLIKDFDGGKTRFLHHDAPPAVQRPDGAGGTATVRRNSGLLAVLPTVRTTPPQHRLGIYDIRIRAPAGTVIFLSCDQYAGYGFQVATAYRNADLLPPPQTIAGSATLIRPIDVTAAGSIDTNFITPHVVTVGAYDDANGLTGMANFHALAEFSSRGPVRDYSNPPLGPIARKPDLAAPGVLISAAQSKDGEYGLYHLLSYAFQQGNRFDAFSGTSMAAPAVAGIIALMLQKKKDMSVADVLARLTAAANVNPGKTPAPGDPGYSDAFGAGRVDALKSWAATH